MSKINKDKNIINQNEDKYIEKLGIPVVILGSTYAALDTILEGVQNLNTIRNEVLSDNTDLEIREVLLKNDWFPHWIVFIIFLLVISITLWSVRWFIKFEDKEYNKNLRNIILVALALPVISLVFLGYGGWMDLLAMLEKLDWRWTDLFQFRAIPGT